MSSSAENAHVVTNKLFTVYARTLADSDWFRAHRNAAMFYDLLIFGRAHSVTPAMEAVKRQLVLPRRWLNWQAGRLPTPADSTFKYAVENVLGHLMW